MCVRVLHHKRVQVHVLQYDGMSVQECLHKCLTVCVWKEMTTGGLAVVSLCSTQGRWSGWQTVLSVTHTNVGYCKMVLLTILALICICVVLMLHFFPCLFPTPSSLVVSYPSSLNLSLLLRSWNYHCLFPSPPYSLLTVIQNPPFSLFLLRLSLSSYLLSAILILCVRCIVTPMCEMHFKDAACWKSLLVSLPNRRSFS